MKLLEELYCGELFIYSLIDTADGMTTILSVYIESSIYRPVHDCVWTCCLSTRISQEQLKDTV
jgi:hypothetical protein